MRTEVDRTTMSWYSAWECQDLEVFVHLPSDALVIRHAFAVASMIRLPIDNRSWTDAAVHVAVYVMILLYSLFDYKRGGRKTARLASLDSLKFLLQLIAVHRIEFAGQFLWQYCMYWRMSSHRVHIHGNRVLRWGLGSEPWHARPLNGSHVALWVVIGPMWTSSMQRIE